MDDKFTYDADFLVWTERQATALRSLARARADLPNELDLEHVAEEIEDLGRSEFNAVRSLIRNIMIHLLKAASDPDARALAHWSAEIRAFHRVLLDRLSPAMRARADMQALWRDASEDAIDDLVAFGRTAPAALPDRFPFDLEDLTARRLAIPELLAKMTAA